MVSLEIYRQILDQATKQVLAYPRFSEGVPVDRTVSCPLLAERKLTSVLVVEIYLTCVSGGYCAYSISSSVKHFDFYVAWVAVNHLSPQPYSGTSDQPLYR